MNERDGQCDRLVEAVGTFIDDRALIPQGAGVVVGVSGGSDSVALLGVLHELAGRAGRRWSLTVAHLNHGLRPGADADESFVANLASQRNLPCLIEHGDIAAEARRNGRSIEETGRSIRYAFLEETARNVGACCVAVGHHADDNVETVLYRIIRGTHIRGVAGIPAARMLKNSQVRLVRPLLEIRRKDIESFCRARRLPWRTDPTNADISFRRNLIRHELLPLLREELNPRVDEAVLRLSAAAREVEEYLLARAEEVLDGAEQPIEGDTIALDRELMERQPSIVRKVAMRLVLEKLEAPLGRMSAERLEELAVLFESEGPKAVALGGEFLVRREGERVVIARTRNREALPEERPVILPFPGLLDLGGGRKIGCEIQPFDQEAFAAHCSARPPGIELIDADQVRGPLVCRPRRCGDVFRPLGCPGRQSVSDFLSNLKVPPHGRELVRCIGDDLGIVYLVPLRIDHRVRVTSRTRNVLRIAACGFDS